MTKIAPVLFPTTLPTLYDPESARLDAERIAEYLDVPLEKLAQAIGRDWATVHRRPAAAAIQQDLLHIKLSLDVLAELFGAREIIREWLNTPHPDLDGRTALSVILEGHAEAVEGMLVGAMLGIPG